MNEAIAVFWIFVLFILRIGLPLMLVIIMGNLYNTSIERQRKVSI